jgi:hypothetical protein
MVGNRDITNPCPTLPVCQSLSSFDSLCIGRIVLTRESVDVDPDI